MAHQAFRITCYVASQPVCVPAHTSKPSYVAENSLYTSFLPGRVLLHCLCAFLLCSPAVVSLSSVTVCKTAVLQLPMSSAPFLISSAYSLPPDGVQCTPYHGSAEDRDDIILVHFVQETYAQTSMHTHMTFIFLLKLFLLYVCVSTL